LGRLEPQAPAGRAEDLVSSVMIPGRDKLAERLGLSAIPFGRFV